MTNIDVSAVYVDAQELALLHLNLGAPEEVNSYFINPHQLLLDDPTTTINYSLGEVMDAKLFQNIMDYFYELTGSQ